MMTREMMWKVLEEVADITVWEDTADEDEEGFHVTVEDFGGFDEDWCELEREYEDEEGLDAFLKMLERECVSKEGDMYVVYHFEDFDVEVGFASFDI